MGVKDVDGHLQVECPRLAALDAKLEYLRPPFALPKASANVAPRQAPGRLTLGYQGSYRTPYLAAERFCDLRMWIRISSARDPCAEGTSEETIERKPSITTAALLGHQRYAVALETPARSAIASVTAANPSVSSRSLAACRIARCALSLRVGPVIGLAGSF